MTRRTIHLIQGPRKVINFFKVTVKVIDLFKVARKSDVPSMMYSRNEKFDWIFWQLENMFYRIQHIQSYKCQPSIVQTRVCNMKWKFRSRKIHILSAPRPPMRVREIIFSFSSNSSFSWNKSRLKILLQFTSPPEAKWKNQILPTVSVSTDVKFSMPRDLCDSGFPLIYYNFILKKMNLY